MGFIDFIDSLYKTDFLVILAFVIELFSCLFIFAPFLKRRKFHVILIILSFIFIAGIIYAFSLINIPEMVISIQSLLAYSLFIGMCFLVFDDTPKAILFVSIASLTIQHFFMSISNVLTLLISSPGSDNYQMVNFFCEFGSFAIGFTTSYLLVRPFHKRYEANLINNSFIFSGTLMFIAIFFFHDWAIYYGFMSLAYRVLDAVLCLNSVVFLFIDLSRSNEAYQKATLIQLMEAEKKRYTILETSMEEIRRKAHDLKYLEKAKNFDKNFDVAEDYNEHFDDVLLSGNPLIDNIITEKSLYCSKNNITFTYIVDSKDLGFIKPMDLAVMLGNLLDNCIEAVKEYEDKSKQIISLNISSKVNHIIIHTENYCEHKVRFRNGLPLTSKADKEYHGFGARSIKYITEKYHGHLYMKMENKVFIANISLPIPEE